MATAVTTPKFSFDELKHEYRDEHDIIVPSVTQLLKSEGFINFDGIPFSVLERKRRLGSLVHQAAELWERGESLDEYEIPEAAWSYLEGVFNFANDSRFHSERIEEPRMAVVYGMRYGMRLDREGEFEGKPYILELKCGASESPVWGLQMAFYDMGLTGKPQPQRGRAALQLGPQFPRRYKLHLYEDAADYRVALNALANDVWKRNKKLAHYEPLSERLEVA